MRISFFILFLQALKRRFVFCGESPAKRAWEDGSNGLCSKAPAFHGMIFIVAELPGQVKRVSAALRWDVVWPTH
jgi:hypothetical protein